MKVLPITSSITLEKCKNLQVQDTDIFICSYPKSGTTWTQNIVCTLATKSCDFQHVSNYAPFFEIDPHWKSTKNEFTDEILRNQENINRRIFNTHLLWNMMPQNGNGKYIYLIRDGRDTATSFFHHLSNQQGAGGGFTGNFEEFFTQWINGELPYGKWSEHIKAWSEAVSDPRVLFIRYEDLKMNLEETIDRIIRHLNFDITVQEKKKFLVSFSLDSMKKNKDQFQPQSVQWKEGFEFIRKGQIGDHVNHFKDENEKAFQEDLKSTFPHGMMSLIDYYN